METVCKEGMCCGCYACVERCSKQAISIVDNKTSLHAVIDNEKCIHCNLCHKVCQVCSPVELHAPLASYQGWVDDPSIRMNSSSGGLAAELSRQFIQEGGKVCSCLFQDGEFVFHLASTVEELRAFSGSKYVKSNPSAAYSAIQAALKQGNQVLFIGLPCQVAGLKKAIGDCEHLYTADLICHGTPSQQLFQLFMKQHGFDLRKIRSISFRDKNKWRISQQGADGQITKKGVMDQYSISFLNGLCYTENCYSCQYAALERASDITLGDSWGSKLPREETVKGISLVLCQTEKGKKLVERSNLKLFPVDLDQAVAYNHQLHQPTEKPEKRNWFFSNLKNKDYDKLIWSIYPLQCFKQEIKRLLNLGGE